MFFTHPSPKVPLIDEGFDVVTDLQALSASNSSESEDYESQKLSAAQFDTDVQLEETSATVMSSKNNRELQLILCKIKICLASLPSL